MRHNERAEIAEMTALNPGSESVDGLETKIGSAP